MAHKLLSSVPSIYKEGAGEDKGDTARLQAFIGAIAIGDLVKSTLGPKGEVLMLLLILLVYLYCTFLRGVVMVLVSKSLG